MKRLNTQPVWRITWCSCQHPKLVSYHRVANVDIVSKTYLQSLTIMPILLLYEVDSNNHTSTNLVYICMFTFMASWLNHQAKACFTNDKKLTRIAASLLCFSRRLCNWWNDERFRCTAILV